MTEKILKTYRGRYEDIADRINKTNIKKDDILNIVGDGPWYTLFYYEFETYEE
jgi:hypothetical protein